LGSDSKLHSKQYSSKQSDRDREGKRSSDESVHQYAEEQHSAADKGIGLIANWNEHGAWTVKVGSYLLFSLLLALATPAWGVGGKGELPNPFANKAAAYLLRLDGRDLWGSDPDRRLPPASLTKMMTALLVLERTAPGAMATVSPAAAGETGSRLGLAAGCRMSVGELLAASILNSANDACHALADHVAGSEKQFVSLMNERAGRLGLTGTRYANACGHDAPGHYSTARDLALLAETVMQEPFYARLAALPEGTIATADTKKLFRLTNTNALLGRSAGVKGVKTGFTARAGKCLVAAAERGGKQALLVLLDAPDRWWTADAMLDAAFAEHGGKGMPAGRQP